MAIERRRRVAGPGVWFSERGLDVVGRRASTGLGVWFSKRVDRRGFKLELGPSSVHE